MPIDPAKADGKKSKSTKHLAAISSLAVIAIVLSPITPLPHSDEQRKQLQAAALDCASIGQGIGYVISGGRLQRGQIDILEADAQMAISFNLTAQQENASESLVDKVCSRPEFVQRMNATYNPPLNIVAYACEAASATAGYDALKNLDDRYQGTYCLAAFRTVEFEVQLLSEIIKPAISDRIPAAMERFGNDTDKAGHLNEAKSAIANVTGSLLSAEQLLNSGFVYDAAIALDESKSTIKAMFEREQMRALFDPQSN